MTISNKTCKTPVKNNEPYYRSEFNGLQRSPVPNSKVTIEDCLFSVMTQTKIVDNVAMSDYIAGGRTDVGVHAINNVFSIIVNSKLSEEEIKKKLKKSCRILKPTLLSQLNFFKLWQGRFYEWRT